MSRSRMFDQLRRIITIGKYCNAEGVSTREGLARLEEATELSRRRLLKSAGAVVAGAAVAKSLHGSQAWAAGWNGRVAIVGAGLSGLVTADRLRAKGVTATLYEANTRVGGRVHSTDAFPGQVAEMGGELIDNLHKTMLAYANEFNLLKEDLGKAPGEKRFYFFGQHHSEAEVVDEYRQMVTRMRPDLKASSGAPTFFSHNDADVALDATDLGTYIATRGEGLPLIQKVLEQAYVAEYGLELAEQSSLNMLLFLHLDRASKFREYGVFSDERYHLIGGNDQIAHHIHARLPGPVHFGMELVRLGKNASGQFELYFRGAAPELADTVVLAIPFSVLRRVTLDASLGLSADKLRAIQTLGYGANGKTMIGFQGRPWADLGGNGLTYADLPNVQTTWETNYTRAGATSVLTDYSGGARGLATQVVPPPVGSSSSCNSCHNGPGGFFDIDDFLVQEQVDAFLTDLDQVYPGAKARATRVDGKYLVKRGHWVPQRYSRGSYTCYLPNQFTQVAGLEGQAAGALKFAGEHANSFYDWQGYMEGACLAGIDAADAVLADIQAGRI